MDIILNNKIIILLILLSISLFIYIVQQQKKIDKLEKQINTFNEQNTKYLLEINKLRNNIVFIERFIIFYNILTDILTSKLGAKADGFTYRTFDYKKENGVTIEKKVNTKKVKVKSEVGYIIKDKYFIKKADLDALLLEIKAHLKPINIKDSSKQEIAHAMLTNLILAFKSNPSLFHIKVEEVRGDNTFVINN